MNARTSDVISSGESKWRTIVFLFPVAAVLFFVVLKLGFKDLYLEVVQEDGVIENLQFAFCFMAGWIAWRVARHFRTTRAHLLALAYFLLSLALFFVALEEISWGQRIFGFHGPTFVIENNTQKEFTLHNQKTVQPFLCNTYILVSFLCAFTDMLLPRRFKNRFKFIVGFVVPDRVLAFYFIPTFVAYLYMDHVGRYLSSRFGLKSWLVGGFIVWKDQEPAEFLLSLGVLLFVLTARYRQKCAAGDTAVATGSRP